VCSFVGKSYPCLSNGSNSPKARAAALLIKSSRDQALSFRRWTTQDGARGDKCWNAIAPGSNRHGVLMSEHARTAAARAAASMAILNTIRLGRAFAGINSVDSAPNRHGSHHVIPVTPAGQPSPSKVGGTGSNRRNDQKNQFGERETSSVDRSLATSGLRTCRRRHPWLRRQPRPHAHRGERGMKITARRCLHRNRISSDS
jgi:hypothetical protein